MKKYHINTILISQLPYVLHRPFGSIAELSGLSRSTWYKVSKHPDTITVQQMLAIANGTKIPARHFLSDQVFQYVGTLDEYVIEDGYQACYYDVEAMRKRIGPGTPITWKAASEVMKVYWTNASHSLMSERRLPVSTLLDLCTAFAFNPFDLIVDNNPPARTRKTSKHRGIVPSSADEVAILRREVAAIKENLAQLEEKYSSLASSQKYLASHIGVKIGKAEGNYIVLAADFEEPYNKKKK